MAQLLKANRSAYDQAIALLQAGEAVVLPTETVYGLAALASNDTAVSNIYRIKGRPTSKPLSVVVNSVNAAAKIASITPLAKMLMEEFWPGPLTLVLPLKRNGNISKHALAGGNTIGIRCPDIEWMDYFKTAGFHAPLVLPSANTSGNPPPTDAMSVSSDIGDKISVIVDGGHCKTGVESTIIALESGKVRLLRRGAIGPEAFAPFDIEWILS